VEKIKTAKSEALFAEAQKHLVGGVNSPVRAFGAVAGTPRFIDSADGPFLHDVDGNEYIDFIGSWGAMILGHRPPVVLAAVKKMLENGTSFGAPTAIEVEMAQLVKTLVPSIEQLRFTSSGTEATMSAVRLSRAVTKRDRLLKFAGGYHGHSDSLLVSAGSGATTFGVPSSAGVPKILAQYTWVLPFNDSDALEEIFRTQGPNIAAAIVEPVAGNMGLVRPDAGFLQKLRQLCTKYGTMLIFDEVMTGFRLGLGGVQGLYEVTPDITCLGKIIGGGFPVGAFGGPEKIMKMVTPLGPVYQAGTLSGNPIAMAAGLATLKSLAGKPPYAALEKATKAFLAPLIATAAKLKIPVQVNQIGSMFTVFFNDDPVTDYFSALQSDLPRYSKFFHAALKRGVYFPPSQFEAAFISTAHTPAVLKRASAACCDALKEIK
jgi:glutamate-1-semialdehyde 2,1-aminomutase